MLGTPKVVSAISDKFGHVKACQNTKKNISSSFLPECLSLQPEKFINFFVKMLLLKEFCHLIGLENEKNNVFISMYLLNLKSFNLSSQHLTYMTKICFSNYNW